ncbi:MAG: hypothetical protein IJO83_00935 [Clostridia bacterium]|nr:hypothetical protein [Clostridia bacterium]
MAKMDEILGKAKDMASDAMEKAKEYDYKGKAEELKEKAAETVEKAKAYDYEAKAKEMSETVKNYDYKSEAENIRNGGIKYFWNKHKKLAIIVLVVLIIGVIKLFSGNGSDAMFIRNDDTAVDIAIDRTYKAVGGKDPQFVSADIIERNKNSNGYIIEVIWKEDTAYRFTTNFVVFVGIKDDSDKNNIQYSYNYLFTQSENYEKELVPKLKAEVDWDNQ